MTETEILERLVFVGGAPRSGTTFAAKSLNLHPEFAVAIDDHVFECWGLYGYRDRTGLVQELRTREMDTREAQQYLGHRLFADGRLVGVAPSGKTAGYPLLADGVSTCASPVRSVLDRDLTRHAIPLSQFPREWRLCLKSPEITFVLPRLADLFPTAQFVMVYRPVNEIAASMYRMGSAVTRFPVYHRRWMEEKNRAGEWVPPPGVPVAWRALWSHVSDFQRCVIYAASYVRALAEGAGEIGAGRCWVYNHTVMRASPEGIFRGLARFLEVEASGFHEAQALLESGSPPVPVGVEGEYDEMARELSLERYLRDIQALTCPTGSP